LLAVSLIVNSYTTLCCHVESHSIDMSPNVLEISVPLFC
jgi:hypothetical protein